MSLAYEGPTLANKAEMKTLSDSQESAQTDNDKQGGDDFPMTSMSYNRFEGVDSQTTVPGSVTFAGVIDKLEAQEDMVLTVLTCSISGIKAVLQVWGYWNDQIAQCNEGQSIVVMGATYNAETKYDCLC